MKEHSPRPTCEVAPVRPWTKPQLAQLPKLTDLTLVTGGPIPGEGDGGGGTVF
jgi:hypothetical protein